MVPEPGRLNVTPEAVNVIDSELTSEMMWLSSQFVSGAIGM